MIVEIPIVALIDFLTTTSKIVVVVINQISSLESWWNHQIFMKCQIFESCLCEVSSFRILNNSLAYSFINSWVFDSLSDFCIIIHLNWFMSSEYSSNSSYKLINLNKNIVVIAFHLQEFFSFDHRWAKDFFIKELLQITQIIIVTNFRFSKSFFNRDIRVFSWKISNYFIDWVLKKQSFRQTINKFKIATKQYKVFTMFIIFQKRKN